MKKLVLLVILVLVSLFHKEKSTWVIHPITVKEVFYWEKNVIAEGDKIDININRSEDYQLILNNQKITFTGLPYMPIYQNYQAVYKTDYSFYKEGMLLENGSVSSNMDMVRYSIIPQVRLRAELENKTIYRLIDEKFIDDPCVLEDYKERVEFNGCW